MSFENERAQGAGDFAIRVTNVSKCYHIYDKPQDRLKQSLWRGWKQYYREFWALKDVSFEIAKGETVGIIGRNGSGKSTLLQIIAGTLTPSSGEIEIKGRVAALLELGSGFNPDFTGRENIYLNASILGLKRSEIDARFDDIVAFADIGDFIEQPVKTYSSGMFVRLAFAIQANIDPDIFIVDEALAVGDAYFVHRCMLRFHEMQQRGTTIVLVTHDASAVKRLCRKAVWISGGRLRMVGDSSDTVGHYLADLFHIETAAEESAPPTGDSPPNTRAGLIDVQQAHPAHTDPWAEEDTIPNCDRRLGDQACSVVGVGLYDTAMRPIRTIANASDVILRVSIRNNRLPPSAKMTAGYIFRNFRGEELASTNSTWEGVDIPPRAIGEITTLTMRIALPLLHPGAYSLSPSIGYFNVTKEISVADRVENAIVLDVTSSFEINTPLRFKTTIELVSPTQEDAGLLSHV